jgi:hypothetical protein
VTHPSAWSLALVYAVFWVVFVARTWPVPALIALDIALNTAIGVAYTAIVLHHPSPLVAVLEGELALMSVLSFRALLVPSSVRRTALVGMLMCASLAIMLVAEQEHFSTPTLAYSTLVFIFATWSSIVVVYSSVASSVLYGLRRAVEDAKSFGQYTLLEKLGDLEAVLLRCLEKKPNVRPSSAEELAAALSACAGATDWTSARARRWWSDSAEGVKSGRADRAAKTGRWSTPREQTIAVNRPNLV